ncbi:MAG: respiratory-chain NADH dehydrogenase domain 51 kDa subunit [Comamonadaceae bacterium]|nr:MAG: respiratory-chain NADH dehydrogenase domain 51 kDa subunit [Comamonadaceae bacterium]
MNEIANKARAAGVVGAGGAGFPTHVKLMSAAEIYLVNGAECEPLLKVDQQLAVKYAPQLVRGLQLAMQAVGAREGIIAFKAKYVEAIAAVQPLLASNMRIHILKDIYPAGDEVITIWLATGRRVPPAALPKDVGVAVNNVLTLINLARAVDDNAPVVDRTLTISGAVSDPITVTVPIGTSLREVMARAGSITVAKPYFINGGPMMGKLLDSIDQPVTKTTGGIIVLPEDHVVVRRHRQPMQDVLAIARAVCEQCNLCTELCPRHLIGHELHPALIVRSANYRDMGKPSVLLSALTCSECAICEQWACPVNISPMRINVALKAQFRAEGARYVGDLRPLDPMAEHRLVPTSRLVTRLGIAAYNKKAPLDESSYSPAKVVLNLRQHVGVAAVPVVQVGDPVQRGQLLADIPADALGARLHASISGRVAEVTAQSITLTA